MRDAGAVDLTAEVSKGLVAKVAMAILGFGSTVAFTRFLSPEALGGYFLILTLVAVAGRPLLGFSVACKKRYSEANADRDELVTLLLLTSVGAVVIVSGAGALLGPWLSDFTGIGATPVYFVALFATVEAFKVTRQLVDGLGQLGTATMLNLARSGLAIGVQVTLLWLGYGVVALVGGALVASVASVIGTLYVLDASFTLPRRETIRSVGSFAKWSVPTEAIGQVYSQLDLLLLGFLVAPNAVGYYEVAFRLSSPAAFVASLFGVGIMAKGSNLDSRGKDIRDELENSLDYASIIAIPMCFGVLAIGQPLIMTVYGAQYADATPYLLGLGIYWVIRTQASPIGGLVTGLDRPDANLKSVATTVCLNLAAGYALITWIGPIGVVIATVGAELLHYVMLRHYLSTELSDVQYLGCQQGYQVLAGVIMFISVKAIWAVFGAAEWLPVLAAVGIGGLTYGTALVILSEQLRTPVRRLWQARFQTPALADGGPPDE